MPRMQLGLNQQLQQTPTLLAILFPPPIRTQQPTALSLSGSLSSSLSGIENIYIYPCVDSGFLVYGKQLNIRFFLVLWTLDG